MPGPRQRDFIDRHVGLRRRVTRLEKEVHGDPTVYAARVSLADAMAQHLAHTSTVPDPQFGVMGEYLWACENAETNPLIHTAIRLARERVGATNWLVNLGQLLINGSHVPWIDNGIDSTSLGTTHAGKADPKAGWVKHAGSTWLTHIEYPGRPAIGNFRVSAFYSQFSGWRLEDTPTALQKGPWLMTWSQGGDLKDLLLSPIPEGASTGPRGGSGVAPYDCFALVQGSSDSGVWGWGRATREFYTQVGASYVLDHVASSYFFEPGQVPDPTNAYGLRDFEFLPAPSNHVGTASEPPLYVVLGDAPVGHSKLVVVPVENIISRYPPKPQALFGADVTAGLLSGLGTNRKAFAQSTFADVVDQVTDVVAGLPILGEWYEERLAEREAVEPYDHGWTRLQPGDFRNGRDGEVWVLKRHGWLHMRGFVRRLDTNVALFDTFILPAAFRPSTSRFFAVTSENVNAPYVEARITAGGAFQVFAGGSVAWASLDGVAVPL